MLTAPWESLLLSWLHDPVDKAADIRGHEGRARRYAAIVLGREVTEAELKGGTPDHIASAYERLPMPRGDRDETRVGPENGELTVFHPLSAEATRNRTFLFCLDTTRFLLDSGVVLAYNAS